MNGEPDEISRAAEELTVDRIVDAPPLEPEIEPPSLAERAEAVRVWWTMLDAQAKQALIVASLYVGLTILDLVGSVAKRRMGAQS